MPSERAYRFLVTSGDQTSAAREFQQTVRSHAATVSRPGRRRQACTRKRNDGEGVIVFESTTTLRQYHRILPRTACADGLATGNSTRNTSQPARRTQSRQRGQPNDTTNQPLASNISRTHHRLRVDYLSGNTFSPLQHLPTYHAPYLPGVVNHYIHNLLIPIPELDNSATVPLFRAVWLPIVFHDPLIFQVIILFAATHYATFTDPDQYDSLRPELLALKQFALVALIQTVQVSQVTLHGYANEAQNSKDILIAAAAKMASYEAIWGTAEAVSSTECCSKTRLISLRSTISTCLLFVDCFVSKEDLIPLAWMASWLGYLHSSIPILPSCWGQIFISRNLAFRRECQNLGVFLADSSPKKSKHRLTKKHRVRVLSTSNDSWGS